MTQQNKPIGGNPSFDAFKSFRTDFLRHRANITDKNRKDDTVAANIDHALKGMLYHFDTVPVHEYPDLKNHLVKFRTIHHSILKEKYNGMNTQQTPLGVYAQSFNLLFEKVSPTEAEV